MDRRPWWLRGAGVLLVSAGVVLGTPSLYAEKLPVFKLKPAKVDKTKAREVFTRGMGAPPTEEDRPNEVSYKSGRKVLEVDKRSGRMFMADMEKLWNPKLRPALPEQAKAKETADKFLNDNGLIPADQRVKVAFSHYSESAAGADMPGQVNRQLLDRQVNYKTDIAVKDPNGGDRSIPVVGGGGKHKVAIGDQGKVVGFAGGWREIDQVASEEEILPQLNAEAEYKKQFGNMQVRNVKSRLAYYSAPPFEEQSVLAPVWVVSGELQTAKGPTPMREVMIPATKYGPRFDPGLPPKPRGQATPPSNNGDEGKKASWLTTPSKLFELIEPKAYAQAGLGFECGTSWIGPSQGLGGSPGNKQGFVDQCRGAGWDVIFDWGEANAFESDWNASDDSYVDNADLAFYTGHAGPWGWVLNPPSDTGLSDSDASSSGIDMWGNTDLEWMIIAACGPHQSTHFTTGTTNAFDRWRNAFDGMHVMLAYGAVTFDNTSEGRRFMELSRAGWNVIDAWFRTAWEIQPSTNGWGPPNGPYIYVTAMYAHNGDHCARNDHLWNMGSTCADVVGSTQQRYLMWSGT